MDLLYRSDYFQVRWAPMPVLHVMRSELAFPSLAAAAREFAAVADCVEQCRPRQIRVLYDARAAPGSNDPAFEATVQPHVNRLLAAAERWALLVRTAVGKLQMQRLAREQGNRLRRVFDREDEARRYLEG